MYDATFQNTTEFSEFLAKYPDKDALIAANLGLRETVEAYRTIEHETKVIDETIGKHAPVCFDDITETMHLETITEMQDYLRYILAEHFVQMYEDAEV